MTVRSDDSRESRGLRVFIAIVAAFLNLIALVLAGELQRGAATVLVARNHLFPEMGPGPYVAIWVGFIGFLTPIALVVLSSVRRWSLSNYLAWIVAVAFVAMTIAAFAVFRVYQFWADNQPEFASSSSVETHGSPPTN
jgi:hypothetical protein